ncbi:MAG: hypothetical protein ACP5UM_07400, partial [Anaerolineae bacterium]
MATILALKGPVGLAVFLAVLGAAFLQMQVRRILPPVLPGRPVTLVAWHRWLGRIALAGFLVDSAFCLVVIAALGFPPTPRYVLHALFAALGALAFGAKVWIVRRKVRWGTARLVPLGAGLALLQTGVFLTGTL